MVGISTRDEPCRVPGSNFFPSDEISLSCMDWLIMNSFSTTFKWIVLRSSWPTSWSCEIEVSHMRKKPISYRHNARESFILILTHLFSHCIRPVPQIKVFISILYLTRFKYTRIVILTLILCPSRPASTTLVVYTFMPFCFICYKIMLRKDLIFTLAQIIHTLWPSSTHDQPSTTPAHDIDL